MEIGKELHGFERVIELRSLVMYAGASDDFNPLHYDFEFAKKSGLDKPVAHGMYNAALMTKVITDVFHPSSVKRVEFRFKSPVPLGERIRYGGKVVSKEERSGRTILKIELWAKKSSGEEAVSGFAEVEI